MTFTIRPATNDDFVLIKKWLLEPGVLSWFPMEAEKEVEDAAKIWVFYSNLGSCFIAEMNGEPCGSILLNLVNSAKTKHQCLISIIVSEKYRNQGIGKSLLEFIEKVAREKFNIELLHLEV